MRWMSYYLKIFMHNLDILIELPFHADIYES